MRYRYCPDDTGDTYFECDWCPDDYEDTPPHCERCKRSPDEHEKSDEYRPLKYATGIPLRLDDPRRRA